METIMLAVKMDLLMKRLEECAQKTMKGTVQAIDSHMTSEVCGNVRRSGNDCPETHEDVMNNNNGFHLEGGLGWNQSQPKYQEGNSVCNSNFAD
jgi:hypothetical protein